MCYKCSYCKSFFWWGDQGGWQIEASRGVILILDHLSHARQLNHVGKYLWHVWSVITTMYYPSHMLYVPRTLQRVRDVYWSCFYCFLNVVSRLCVLLIFLNKIYTFWGEVQFIFMSLVLSWCQDSTLVQLICTHSLSVNMLTWIGLYKLQPTHCTLNDGVLWGHGAHWNTSPCGMKSRILIRLK